MDIIRQRDLGEKLFIVVFGTQDVFIKTTNGEHKKGVRFYQETVLLKGH